MITLIDEDSDEVKPALASSYTGIAFWSPPPGSRSQDGIRRSNINKEAVSAVGVLDPLMLSVSKII